MESIEIFTALQLKRTLQVVSHWTLLTATLSQQSWQFGTGLPDIEGQRSVTLCSPPQHDGLQRTWNAQLYMSFLVLLAVSTQVVQ